MSYFEEIKAIGKGTGAFYPETHYPSVETGIDVNTSFNFDSAGNLAVRSPILTDEGSMRDSFDRDSLNNSITGTLTFTNGSKTVVGIGTAFTLEAMNTFKNDYIKLNADSNEHWAKIAKIIDDTNLMLCEPYTGNSDTGVASWTRYEIDNDSGTSLSMSNGKLILSSGTVANSEVCIEKELDYCPLIIMTVASISQRIANQTGFIGVMDNPETPHSSAWFEFTGTDNKLLTCKSSLHNNIETTAIAFPDGFVSSNMLRYRIEVSIEYVQFSIEGITVATHYNLIPDPYATLGLHLGILNSATSPASNTNMEIDTIFISNQNVMQVQSGFTGIPFRVDVAPTSKNPQTSANELGQDVVPSSYVLNNKTMTIQLSGDWTGRVQFLASNDNLSYFPVGAVNTESNVFVSYTQTNGLYLVPNSGFAYLKATVIGYQSGTIYADVNLNTSALPIPSSSPQVGLIDLQSKQQTQVTKQREMRISNAQRICGKTFTGSILDTNYWTSTIASSGTVVVEGGYVSLKTTTSSTSVAKITATSVARFMASTMNVFKTIARFATSGVENNIRQIGVLTSNGNNGFAFELNGTVFAICIIKDGVVTRVSEHFNGNIGDSYILDNNFHQFDIHYDSKGVCFFIDELLLHTISTVGSTTTLTSEFNLYPVVHNTNSNTVTGSPEIQVIDCFVSRLGNLKSQSKSLYINTNGTYILKLGAGQLIKIISTDNNGSFTVYDNVAGSGSILTVIDATAVSGLLEFSLPFNIGLTVVTSGGAKLTIIYE